MSRGVLLCIDLSNQCYKASAAYSTLTSEDRFTGGLYGFLTAVSKAIEVTGATRLIICEDRKPYRRSKLYPAYKELRKTTRDPELYEKAQLTIGLVKQLLAVTGWPLWSIDGFESDDLIAHAARKYRHRFDRIIGMSNDSDLFQLFQYDQFQLYRGKKGLYTREDYDEEWLGLCPTLLVHALALIGTHNEVEGVKGIGPVTAREIVSHPFKLREARSRHAEVVERNLKLIELPHAEFPWEERLPAPTRPYKERELLKFCGMYDITVTTKMSFAFAQVTTDER